MNTITVVRVRFEWGNATGVFIVPNGITLTAGQYILAQPNPMIPVGCSRIAICESDSREFNEDDFLTIFPQGAENQIEALVNFQEVTANG